jgi:hypothetical protein
MPIRNTGALPITEIVTEFGGSTPHGLSEYYANGSFLSPGYFPNPPAVPSTGSPLNVGAFYGKSKRRSINVTISQNTADLDVVPLFSTLLAQSTIPADCFLTINAGVTVYGNLKSALVVAPDTSSVSKFRNVDTLTIINKGNIVGFAGTGGDGGCGINVLGSDGTLGGVAIALGRTTTIINSGTIAGGAKGGKGGTGGRGMTLVTCSAGNAGCTGCSSRKVATGYGYGAVVRNCWCDQGNCRPPGNNCARNPCYSTIDGTDFGHIQRVTGCGGENCSDQGRGRRWKGCWGINNDGYTRQGPFENAWGTQYSGNCPTASNLCGGKGGNGAGPFSNTAIAGANAQVSTVLLGSTAAMKGSAGGLWGSGNSSITGATFLTSRNIGGTILGAIT